MFVGRWGLAVRDDRMREGPQVDKQRETRMLLVVQEGGKWGNNKYHQYNLIMTMSQSTHIVFAKI